MKKILKSLTSLILTLAMMITMIPMSAFASNDIQKGTEKPQNEPSGYQSVGTVKLELNDEKFTLPNGGSKKPSEVVNKKLQGTGMNGSAFSQLGAIFDEVPLLEKDGHFYAKIRWNNEVSSMGNRITFRPLGFAKVDVDFNNLSAEQKETPIESKLVTDQGGEYWDSYIDLGTKDMMNDRKFFWVDFVFKMAGTEFSGLAGMTDKFSIRVLPDYTITSEQNVKMVEAGI